MKTLHIAVWTTCLLALAGCQTLGIEKKHIDYKAGATKAPSLEVPPDLTVPETEDRYAIPAGNGESVESYSDYAKGSRHPLPVAGSNVLPPLKGVQLEKDATQHWLKVNGPPESVWPRVKEFWQQNGYTLKTDDPQAGVMETDWSDSGKAVGPGLRDRYLTRFERSQDGTTNVYITHYGMQQVAAADGKGAATWQPRARDPELEASMLQMLMAKLGSNAPAGGSTQAPAVLQQLSDGSSAIVLSESFDRCWNRVEMGLDQAGIAVDDRDRTSGQLYLRAVHKEEGMLDKLEFWKSSDKQPTRLEVLVHQDAASGVCMVTASTADGSSTADTQRIVDTLYRSMSEQGEPGEQSGTPAEVFPAAPPKLQGAPNNQTILLSESLDRCWSDAQLALERAELKPVDSDRKAGKLFLPAADRDQEGSWFSRLAFWKSGAIKMARPEVVLHRVSNGCEISANDGNGSSNEATQRIIDALYQNLNK